ncbi:MarR family transcriptional regulator [Ensifer sp. Root1252]|nr:MarR family transcriptional regulator [Ensifer sp. Root1252]KQW72697.1 MarR family transcriptional regulator [Ensifer sp. Root127]KQY68880.1 MarR family transcriptional regulator [Ensifer sp. Root142]KRC80715.1 MarR family transcriptional regulator [Ensifer sp. Root231]KRC94533.1 MarR family transcriptional regulator [Ensifer sp. Root258]MBD9491860.1 winged helix-turn-helix transcriptional regulator [Ensifer sp. ENS11]NOV19510.1 MarR family transcriptional regulator [Ensifer canadensis]
MAKNTTTPPAIIDRIGDGFARIATAMRTEAWTAADVIGLNPTQLQILIFLVGRGKAGMRVKQIAAHLGVSQPTATDSINALTRKGFVEKLADPSDARAVAVAATAEGEAAVRRAGMIASATDAAFASLSTLEQEDLLLHLVKIIRTLQASGAIPEQRMCVNCRYFQPNAYPGSKEPHHCAFVNAPFGQADLRIDCGEYETADASSQAAAWKIFNRGAA